MFIRTTIFKQCCYLSADLTRLRNWFCSSLEDRPSEAWQDSDSNDLMRWAEECRAHTESLPTPISEQKGWNINTPVLVSAGSAHTLIPSHVFHKKHPHTSCNWHTLYVIWLTCRYFIQRDQTAQHLWEVQSQQQVAGLKWLWVREGTEGEHEPESHQNVHFPFKANG